MTPDIIDNFKACFPGAEHGFDNFCQSVYTGKVVIFPAKKDGMIYGYYALRVDSFVGEIVAGISFLPEVDLYAEFMPQILSDLRNRGCKVAQVSTFRPGLMRKLGNNGFACVAALFEREL